MGVEPIFSVPSTGTILEELPDYTCKRLLPAHGQGGDLFTFQTHCLLSLRFGVTTFAISLAQAMGDALQWVL